MLLVSKIIVRENGKYNGIVNSVIDTSYTITNISGLYQHMFIYSVKLQSKSRSDTRSIKVENHSTSERYS